MKMSLIQDMHFGVSLIILKSIALWKNKGDQRI
jgi:hypothetical protein